MCENSAYTTSVRTLKVKPAKNHHKQAGARYDSCITSDKETTWEISIPGVKLFAVDKSTGVAHLDHIPVGRLFLTICHLFQFFYLNIFIMVNLLSRYSAMTQTDY